MNKLLILPVILFLNACAAFSYNLETTKGLSLSGDAFKNALHKEYLELAVEENSEGDWTDASFFADKATRAAAGENVGPQAVSERSIPESALADINAAHKALTSALSAKGAAMNTANLARAQATFDCWMQEQEENTQPDDIAKCRNAFEAAMGGKMAMGPDTFIVYFAHDSAAIDGTGRAVIANAVKAAKSGSPKRVQVGGHADRSGDSTYNNALSDRRAKAVAKMLVHGGLKLVKTAMFGEDVNAVKTGDNVQNRTNRRVEIQIRY